MIQISAIRFKIIVFTALIVCVSSVSPFWAHSNAKTKGVKTSYKRYSIFKYQNEDILCEPYIVKEGDWLYKIFKRKGEISKKNFPLFLSIFSEINPQISNIDIIKAGAKILIPLKKTDQNDYELTTRGTIDVPVIEFSGLPQELNLSPYIKKHKIKKGETVSGLMEEDFLNKGGTLSDEGLAVLKRINPNMKNIHMIYEGGHIYLPRPSIRSQPWFQRFVAGEPIKSKPKDDKSTRHRLPAEQSHISMTQRSALERYASLLQGTLLSTGKIHFPGKNNSTRVIDLASTPVIETRDGHKMIILSGSDIDGDLLATMQTHWKHLKKRSLMEILDDLEKAGGEKPKGKRHGLPEYEKLIETLLLQAGYTYIPDSKIPFTINHLSLEATFGRIIRKNEKDVLINFGAVYGSALDILKQQKFEILSLSPGLTPIELVETLFVHLGYETWKNPSFWDRNTINRINGIYAAKNQEKLFVPVNPLSHDAVTYLDKEEITILSVGNGIQDQ